MNDTGPDLSDITSRNCAANRCDHHSEADDGREDDYGDWYCNDHVEFGDFS